MLLFCFRQDLRLHDQPALCLATDMARERGAALLPVVVRAPDGEQTPWGFARVGLHRRRFLADTLEDLRPQLTGRGSGLLEAKGDPVTVLLALAAATGADTLVVEAIDAPEEQAAVDALRAGGLTVHTVWQSNLLHPDDLPWAPEAVPEVFTAFRQGVERAAVPVRPTLPAPDELPPWPLHVPRPAPAVEMGKGLRPDPRSAFPYAEPHCRGGETAALAHLRRYLARGLPHHYKATRNGLMGLDYSSKWSPWLATGALSPRTAIEAMRAFEAEQGASESSYWLWFELLWRDHFRFMHRRFGRALFRARGLSDRPEHRAVRHDAAAFERWCTGRTGQALVDAGMRELAATGYLSNRMRQVVASHLVHELACDWRAGAAWFESQLVDFDVYSNQGNWAYIAGRGTDPRGGRRFDVEHQARTHDPDGAYRRLWAGA
ncbi:DASH family cryptochrome [Hydrogenophaga sp.]|uniref:DASH family cryptochrome n=1 Tax=Hydrogenophaga sp. TaxID=1904254 RepID=UPI003521A3FE